MAQFDELIHQPVRLRIMAAVMTLSEEARISFTALKGVLQVSDGNLGGHLEKLEEAGYILVEKTFVRKKPQTYIAATPRGRFAFQEHLVALQQLLHVQWPDEGPGLSETTPPPDHAPDAS